LRVCCAKGFESRLVMAARAYKDRGVRLLRDAKRATNRDFRIHSVARADGSHEGADEAGGGRHDHARWGGWG